MSNRSIFGPKNGDRYQGETTKAGTSAFEAGRKRLGELAGRPAALVSDGDTMEFLAIGEAATVAYLKAKRA